MQRRDRKRPVTRAPGGGNRWCAARRPSDVGPLFRAFPIVTQALPEIRAVRAVLVTIRQPQELRLVDKALGICDFLDARDLEALAEFERLDELRRRQQGIIRARVQPGNAAAQARDPQLASAEIFEIHVGDLDLASGRRLQPLGDPDDVGIVEIQPGDGPIRLRNAGLLLETERTPLAVELDNAVTLRILLCVGGGDVVRRRQRASPRGDGPGSENGIFR